MAAEELVVTRGARLSLLWLVLWLAPMAPGAAVASGPLGVNGFHAYSPRALAETPDAVASYMAWEAERIAGAGLGWNRSLSPAGGQFKWGDIQPTRGGPYDWSGPDMLVAKAQERGIQILAIVHPFARWDQPGKTDVQYCSPNDAAAWTSFLTTLVERYDGDGAQDMPGLTLPIKHWEISNEVELNFCNGDYGRYATFLSQAYATIKAADPTATVLNGSTALIYDAFNPTRIDSRVRDFWQGFFSSGGGNSIDAFAVHYAVPEPALPLRAFLDQYQGLLDSRGVRKRIWVTETGTYSGSMVKGGVTYPAQTTTYQAAWWVKHVSYALAHNVERVFQAIFDAYEEMPPPGGATGDDWLHRTGWIDSDMRYDRNPKRKPVYFTNQKLASLISGHATVTELAHGDSCGVLTVEAQCASQGKYRYAVGSGSVWVLWNDQGETYTLGVGGDIQRVTIVSSVPRLDATGYPALDGQGQASFDSTEADVLGGTVTVPLSSVPVYVLESPRAAFRASASGANTALTLTATLTLAREDMGRDGSIYVAALAGGSWFLLTPHGWVAWTGGTLPAYATGALVNRSIQIAANADVSGLLGTRVYIGYGLTEADMLANGTFGLVYAVQ